MDDDIRRKMQDAARDLGGDGDPGPLIRRAVRVSAQRRARTTMATFALVAISAAGVVRLSSGGDPTGELINPSATGSISVPTLSPEPKPTTTPTRRPPTPKETRSPSPYPTEKPTYTKRPTPSECSAPTKGIPPEGVSVTVSLTKTSFVYGEPIPIQITVRNDGSKPVTYQASGPDFGLWAIGRNGERWAYNSGLVYTAEMREETLAPGESRMRQAVWDQSLCDGRRANPGAYSILGSWRAWQRDSKTGGWMANPASLEITKA